MRVSRAGALLVAGLLLGGAAAAQTFEDETSVLLVEVPVQLLVDGEPVRGPGPQNFRLFDNGRRREILSFEVLLADMIEDTAVTTP